MKLCQSCLIKNILQGDICTFFFLPSIFSLLNLCSVKNQDAVLKLAVSTLDYSRDGLARVILSKILTASTDVSKLLKH